MFQDYKIAYSEKGDMHKEEAQATLAVGWLLKRISLLLPSWDLSEFSAASPPNPLITLVLILRQGKK
jgi:hypothetical protein